MALVPDFIQEFRDEIHDEKANKDLLELGLDFNKKWDELQKSKNSQYTTGHMQEHFGLKPKIPNFQAMETALKNEYKKKVFEIAKPHMDSKKFEELSEKHATEFQPEADKTMRQLGESQEKMIGLIKEHQETEEQKKARINREIKTELSERDERDKKQEVAQNFQENKVETTEKASLREQIERELRERNQREKDRER